MANFNSEQI